MGDRPDRGSAERGANVMDTIDKDRDIPAPGARTLWTEEPARRRRLPDPVRTSAVRAVIIVAVTLVDAW